MEKKTTPNSTETHLGIHFVTKAHWWEALVQEPRRAFITQSLTARPEKLPSNHHFLRAMLNLRGVTVFFLNTRCNWSRNNLFVSLGCIPKKNINANCQFKEGQGVPYGTLYGVLATIQTPQNGWGTAKETKSVWVSVQRNESTWPSPGGFCFKARSAHRSKLVASLRKLWNAEMERRKESERKRSQQSHSQDLRDRL